MNPPGPPPKGPSWRRLGLWLAAAAAGFALLQGTDCLAATASAKKFEIPAGNAETALKDFSLQAGVQIVFGVDKVLGVRTREVKGRFTPHAALDQMLSGTVLIAVMDAGTGAFAIRRRSVTAEAGSAAEHAASPVPAGDTGATAFADDDNRPINLPKFTVSSTAADRFRLADAVSSERIRGQLLDTPLSIAIASQEMLRDLGADSVYDAMRYFAGVSNGRGSSVGGINDRADFRGFESFTRTVDGLSTLMIPGSLGNYGNFEPSFIERVELVRGPDSILSPTGSPGGSLNIITKSPQATPSNSLAVEAGNFESNKVTVDSTGPLPLEGGSKWSYRVISDYQDGQTYVPGSVRQFDLSAQIKDQISDRWQMTIKYFGQQWELDGAIANPNDNGWYVVAPNSVDGATIASSPPRGTGFLYDGWNGDTNWSHRIDRSNIMSGELTGSILDLISVRLAAMVLVDHFIQDAGYISQAPPKATYDPVTGQEISIAPFDPTSVAEIAYRQFAFNQDEQMQNDYAANFRLHGISLQPIAGWTYQEGRNPYLTTSTSPLPNNNLASGMPFDPPHPAASDYAVAASTAGHSWQFQGYSVMKLGFGDDHFFVLGGDSRLWTRATTTDLMTGIPVTLAGNNESYLGGVLAKPTENVSVYYSFASNAAITAGTSDQPVWQTGKQQEFGIKSEFFNQRLSFTADHFQIDQTNITTPNPLFNTDPSNNPQTLLTDEANRGYDLELAGGVTRDFSVVASFTEMKLRDSFGRRLRNIPDQMANLLLEYRFSSGPLDGLKLLAGVEHNGNTAGETVTGFTPLRVPEQPGFYISAWTVCNLGAGYQRGRYRINVNVENALDSRFVWQPAGRNSVSPYPGTTLRLTYGMHF
jgi:iron complex outermembrane receptor protein